MLSIHFFACRCVYKRASSPVKIRSNFLCLQKTYKRPNNLSPDWDLRTFYPSADIAGRRAERHGVGVAAEIM